MALEPELFRVNSEIKGLDSLIDQHTCVTRATAILRSILTSRIWDNSNPKVFEDLSIFVARKPDELVRSEEFVPIH
jgi:hemerythrin-like domain-containing protein